MSGDSQTTGVQRRIRFHRVTLFIGATCLAFPLALLPGAPPSDTRLLLGAAVTFGLVGLSIVLVPWDKLPEGCRFLMVVGFCTAVAELRASGGGQLAGYGPLLLLPVIWQALYGRGRDLTLTIGAAFLTLVLPIILIGGTQYPATGWRSALLSTVTYSVAAVTVRQLLERVRRHEEIMGQVVHLTRGLTDTEDVRARMTQGIQEIAGSDVVVFSEIDGTGTLRVTASTDDSVEMFDPAPPTWTTIVEMGRQSFASRTSYDKPPFRSVLHQPVHRGDAVVGLVTLGWSTPRRQPPTFARQTIALVAAEAATAIERAALIDRITRLARHDELTGLANRRTWDEHLAQEMSRADRTESCLIVGILDLDHFKRFNDEHGHLAGDRLLKAAAAAWAGQLRPTDMLARWGGEEFAIALPNTDLPGAMQVMERLRRLTPMDQTFSAGITEVSSRDPLDVMQAADGALYIAKESGRDRVVAFDASGRERAVTPAAAPVNA